jgi:hypothetical protein
MKRKKLLLSLLLAFALLAAWFEPTYWVRGVLRGEPFYDGRPASWWAAEWEHWSVAVPEGPDGPAPQSFNGNGRVPIWDDRDIGESAWERIEAVFDRVFRGKARTVWGSFRIIDVNAQPLLRGDDRAALPVLELLARHESPKVRLIARYGIQRLRDAQAS